MSEFSITTTVVKARPRKLKAKWSIDTDWNVFKEPSNKILIVDNADKPHSYGIDASRCSVLRLDEIKEWVSNTVNPSEVEYTGDIDEIIWFRQEKIQTLALMKWSSP